MEYESTIAQLHQLRQETQKGSGQTSHEIGLVRYIPEEVADQAQRLVRFSYNPIHPADYLLNAFEIYRHSVNVVATERTPNPTDIVPHTKVNGIYEWLPPAAFSWQDTKEVAKRAAIVRAKMAGRVVANIEPDQTVYKVDLSQLGFVQDGQEWQSALLTHLVHPFNEIKTSLLAQTIGIHSAADLVTSQIDKLSNMKMDENLEVLGEIKLNTR